MTLHTAGRAPRARGPEIRPVAAPSSSNLHNSGISCIAPPRLPVDRPRRTRRPGDPLPPSRLPMRSRFVPRVSLLACTSLFLAGCGGGASTQEGVVGGSSTVYRISRAAAEGDEKVKPDVQVVVHNHGPGGGFDRYIRGGADIVAASRPAKAKEEADARAAGFFPWTRYVVGYDGITVVVSAKNDFVKDLSVAQLKALFEPGSTVSTWKD